MIRIRLFGIKATFSVGGINEGVIMLHMRYRIGLPKKLSSNGFTLIELMVVVAIIGILAALAIPTMAKYVTKAKQTEVKANMTSIYTAQMTYFVENNHFTQYFTDPISGDRVLEFEIQGDQLYTYDMFGDVPDGLMAGRFPVLPNACYPDWTGGLTSFTILAYANVDKDPAIDTWVLDLNKSPYACHDDFTQATN